MILNLSGGGSSGTALNFKVVGGTTQPVSASENTIWVNTDTDISSWGFSATQPSSPSEGQVWIQTGTVSQAEFNALKKNTVQVYPIAVYQYISGAWAAKTAMTYQDGSWKDWLKYLFNRGDQCISMGGSWTGDGYSHSSTNVHDGTVGDTAITISGSGSSFGVIGKENSIDLSPYTTLKCECSSASGSNMTLRVMSKKVISSANTLASVTLTTGTVSLDLSTINESAYIVLWATDNANATVDAVWLE